jgi:hypothetical protein
MSSETPDRDLLALLQREADARVKLHANHASSKPVVEDCEFVSLIGEAEFSKVSGQPLDLVRRPGGDGGVDFVVPMRTTIDIKTARKPYYLLVEHGHVTADIYVLAEYSDDNQSARLLGWEKGSVVRASPLRAFSPKITSHYIARAELRPMADLLRRIMRLA